MTLLVQSATLHVVPAHRLRHRSHMEARVRLDNDLQTTAAVAMRSCIFPHRQSEGDCDRLDARAAMYVCFCLDCQRGSSVFTINTARRGIFQTSQKSEARRGLDTHELREYQA